MLITRFDPWNDPMCTCPKKYSFNPYTGCSHACIYCYISSYIPNPFQTRLKKNVLEHLEKEVSVIDTYLSVSNSSDPYPPEERDAKITRECLNILKEHEKRVLIVTKSDIITRDLDVLSKMHAAVTMTITTLNADIGHHIEPNAPKPSERLHALSILHSHGIPCGVRLDPIIPEINDKEIASIITAVKDYTDHVTSSTIKPRADAIPRLASVINHNSYIWERRGSSYYLPENQRFSLLEQVENACNLYGLTFSTCREGYPFNAPSCDGSHLIP